MITRPDAMLPVFAHHLCALSVRSCDPQGQDRVDGQNVKRFHKGLCWEVFRTWAKSTRTSYDWPKALLSLRRCEKFSMMDLTCSDVVVQVAGSLQKFLPSLSFKTFIVMPHLMLKSSTPRNVSGLVLWSKLHFFPLQSIVMVLKCFEQIRLEAVELKSIGAWTILVCYRSTVASDSFQNESCIGDDRDELE